MLVGQLAERAHCNAAHMHTGVRQALSCHINCRTTYLQQGLHGSLTDGQIRVLQSPCHCLGRQQEGSPLPTRQVEHCLSRDPLHPLVCVLQGCRYCLVHLGVLSPPNILQCVHGAYRHLFAPVHRKIGQGSETGLTAPTDHSEGACDLPSHLPHGVPPQPCHGHKRLVRVWWSQTANSLHRCPPHLPCRVTEQGPRGVRCCCSLPQPRRIPELVEGGLTRGGVPRLEAGHGQRHDLAEAGRGSLLDRVGKGQQRGPGERRPPSEGRAPRGRRARRPGARQRPGRRLHRHGPLP
mmetsp:Transcript_11722/g.36805  ORF Transcript_11722/g.36805 Transcript_11722/m.36805 type:complete len:293 (+) Transcript_11722:1458-2336(+)